MSERSGHSQGSFGRGFLTAMALVVVLAIGNETAQWVRNHRLPQAAIELLTKPMFSVADLLQVALLLLVIGAMFWMAAVYGPRIN